MPTWFYPLMLIVILAGYVFLFLQGRIARQALSDLMEEIARLRRELADLKTAATAAPPLPAPVDMGPLQAAAARIEERLDAQAGDIQEFGALLVQALEEAGKPRTAPAALRAEEPPAAPSPSEVALRYLEEEGFSRSRILGEAAVDSGTRLLVRASFGDQERQGHVLVRDGRVVRAALEIPASFFP